MSDLKSIWADYKTREKSEPRSKLMELETKIHELEDKQGYDHYNFDKRWEKREKDEGLAEFTEAKGVNSFNSGFVSDISFSFFEFFNLWITNLISIIIKMLLNQLKE